MKRLFRKRWVRWTFGIIAALVGWFVATELYGEWKWSRYVEDARKRGVKLYIEEFLPKEPIPDAENFAAIPVFRQAYANGKGWAEMPKLVCFVGRTRLPDERGSKRFDMAKTIAGLEREKQLKPASGESDADRILKMLDPMEPFFAQIHEAASRTLSWYGVDWSKGLAADISHLPPAIAIGRAFHMMGIALLANGDSGGALKVFKDVERLARSFDEEPTVLPALVAMSLRSLNRLLLADGLDLGEWTDSALETIQRDLDKRDEIARMKFALESERGAFNHTLENNRRARDASLLLGEPFGASWLIRTHLRVSALSSSWWRRNVLWANGLFDVEIGTLDAATGRWDPATNRQSDTSQMGPMNRVDLAAVQMLIPMLELQSGKAALEYAMDRMAALACALERFKRVRGNYPESLSKLVPDFTAALPHDPVTGESFKYSRSDTESYLLYSTGEDGKDDGGAMGEEFREVESGSPDWRWFAPRGE